VLVVIRDGEEFSPKASFVAQLFKLSSDARLLYVIRKERDKFKEKWDHNHIELATSTTAILVNFLLMLLKSPKDLHNGILRQIFHKERMSDNEGFLSVVSHALYLYFANKARTDDIIRFLNKLNSPKVFLIDEFFSLNIVNLKKLRRLGPIIYVSQDVAYSGFGFAGNVIARKLIYRLEHDAIAMSDVVVACSERDRLKYVEMGAKKAVFYPNIYPITEFEPCDKDKVPSISIVLRKAWGSPAYRSLLEVLKALSYVGTKIRVYSVGMKPQQVPGNIELQHYEYIPSKLDYLTTLSKSWIGINIGFHRGGTNERKYDYAMSSLVVFSDNLGARGDLLFHEYTYIGSHDLAAKLEQLLEFGREKIVEMGVQNRKQVISLAEKQRQKLLKTVNSLVSSSREL
jgi:hypothetical protein